jgi:hypothetical protein
MMLAMTRETLTSGIHTTRVGIGLIIGVVAIAVGVWTMHKVWHRKVLVERFIALGCIILGILTIHSALTRTP